MCNPCLTDGLSVISIQINPNHQKKILSWRGGNSIFRWTSKGKWGNRACVQNVDIVQVLNEESEMQGGAILCSLCS